VFGVIHHGLQKDAFGRYSWPMTTNCLNLFIIEKRNEEKCIFTGINNCLYVGQKRSKLALY